MKGKNITIFGLGLLVKTRLLVGKRGANKRNLEIAMSIILLNFDCVIMQK